MPWLRRTFPLVARWGVLLQLALLGVGAGLLTELWRQYPGRIVVELFVLVAFSGTVTLIGWVVLAHERRASLELVRRMAADREITATLEQAVISRTSELEEAQRVLQRMWWLGQQITLELNPQRVLERFLEAVVDIAQADGGIVGLIGDDGKVRIMAGAGVGSQLAGGTVPLTGSAMGGVIRTGTRWTAFDLGTRRNDVDAMLYERVKHSIRGVAIVPISRRGERIGAVTIGTREPREFTAADLERIEVMGDLLSVSLENAELVETLRQAEWRFRTLFRAAPDAVFTVLRSGRIREANDAVRDLTGSDPLQTVGLPIADLVVDADRTKLKAALDRTFDGESVRLEVSFQHAGRTAHVRRIVAVAMSRLPEADPPSVLLVGRDMTSEREMRLRLMESDRLAAVGELVAGVAHEVNNPLSSISAFAQLLLRDTALSAAHRESVEVIREETVRASQVVKDLLAFARRSEPQRGALDLNGVISRTLRLRGYQLVSNRVEVETELLPDLPPVVGDGRQLQQVCLNLMTNAIQAMSIQGGGTLVVSTRYEAPHVVLDVRDTGPGIPEEARAHIFEPFFTTKDEGEGTGLGLSVSYGIVSAHGGQIEVASSSPSGTTVRVTLPAVSPYDQGNRAGETNVVTLRSPLSGIRLLLIDDDEELGLGMRAFGELRGFAVLTACTGAEGLELVRTSSIDGVICRMRLLDMDGLTFQEQLRRERPGLAARTVFITGDVVAMSRQPAATHQPVLCKPFAFETLEETLVALLRGAPAAPTSGRS